MPNSCFVSNLKGTAPGEYVLERDHFPGAAVDAAVVG